MKNGLLIAILIVGIFWLMARVPEPHDAASPPNQIEPPVHSSPQIDKSPKMQRERDAFIQRMIREGVFLKVDYPGTLPHVYVTRRFLDEADVDAKQSFLEVVYCLYFDSVELGNMVVVRDALTGERIGSYSPDSGLDISTR